MTSTTPIADELREQGRGVTGALMLVGISSMYTMETWWLAWRLPIVHLTAYAFVGLAGVMVVLRYSGFREEERGRPTGLTRLGLDFSALLLQSVLAAYLFLFAFGILEFSDSPSIVARMGLIQVVPLGVGAGLANELLAAGERGHDGERALVPAATPHLILGAVFFSFLYAPTEEMERMALHAGPWRLAAVVAMSVSVVYLVLYELEFRGHGARVEGRSRTLQVGSAFFVYLVGVTVGTGLLAAFGHFNGTTFSEAVQMVVVLGFPASIGGAAAEVVL